jgi:hypothetical protein
MVEYSKRPSLCEAESDSRSGYRCVGTAYATSGLCLHHLHLAEAEAVDEDVDADDELSPTMQRLIAVARRPPGQNSTGT